MHKILLIEDEQILQKVYYRILTIKGFEVNVASDGFEALQVLEVFTPDIILLDILMPKMDGLEFLKRADIPNKMPNVKVIAFSNFSDSVKINKVMELGAVKSVLKSSLSPKDLVDLINQQLNPSH